MARRLVNVLQLISSLEVGGSEKLLLELLAASRDDDRVNYVVVVMNQSVNPAMQERLDRMGLPTYYLNRPESHMHLRYLADLLRIIRRHKIEVVHAHNFGSKMWGTLCKLALPHLKLMFTIHDTFMLPRLGPTQILVHKHVIDMNVAISRAVAALCDKRGIGNYRQIYNGIPLKRFENPDKLSLKERLDNHSYEDKPLRILHVGRMDVKTKGQDILVEAVRQCREQGMNLRLMLMGGVNDYCRDAFEDLQQQVVNTGLESHVEYLLDRTDVPEMLAEADLFVLPSRKEGLGLVLLEAMSAGVPVIASKIDGPAELVEDGHTGWFFEAGNAKDLAAKIRNVYENPETVDAVRENALRHVRQFDINTMKMRYYELYDSLVVDGEKVVFQGWQPGMKEIG